MAMLPWWIHYPYVNNEIQNLDWLLQISNENTDMIKNFIGINTIKYADPILWDITSQYEANTIVVDPQTGDAYISTKAVPYGVALSNESYWTRIYNYAAEIHTFREQIAADEQLSTTATAPRSVDDLVFLNGLLYRVTAPMIAGDSYVDDSNCVKTTINAELLRLHTSIGAEAEARAEADTALGCRIDDEAEARAEADTALGGRIDDEAEARAEADTALGAKILDYMKNENTSPASLMTYNSTPVDNISRLNVVDGNDTTPSESNNNPSVMINRVDDSYHGDTSKNIPQYILYDLYATMKRIATSCGYASTILGYMEDNTENGSSAGGSTQSVAVSGMAYVTKNSSVWGLYGDVCNKSEGLANVQACELNVHNETGVDYQYNASNPVQYPFSCGNWIVTGGNADNSFAVGIATFDIANSHWHVGEYYAPYSVIDMGIDMQATPTINIKLHGAKTDPLNGQSRGGIGIDFDGHYSLDETVPEVNHGAIHLHNEAICFGETGLGHILFNQTNGTLEFWYNGSRRGYINMGGTDHEL